jgi:hypothetical protein
MTAGVTIEVMYSCRLCEIRERAVHVRERMENENVLAWVDAARQSVSEDHLRISPTCSSRQFDLAVPLRGDPQRDPTVRVGQARRQ